MILIDTFELKSHETICAHRIRLILIKLFNIFIIDLTRRMNIKQFIQIVVIVALTLLLFIFLKK